MTLNNWVANGNPNKANAKLSGGTPSAEVPCSACGGTGQDDPPPGKYHGLCPKCGGTGKQNVPVRRGTPSPQVAGSACRNCGQIDAPFLCTAPGCTHHLCAACHDKVYRTGYCASCEAGWQRRNAGVHTPSGAR